MWEPRRLTTVWAFTACYRYSFFFYPFLRIWSCCLATRIGLCSAISNLAMILRQYKQKDIYKETLKLSVRLINQALCHEEVWGSGGIAPPFLTSALVGCEWSAARLCRFTPGERAPGTHWIRGCVGPRAGLDAVEKRQMFHCRESNPGRPAHRYTDPEHLSKGICIYMTDYDT
jgi:hypothetical protein